MPEVQVPVLEQAKELEGPNHHYRWLCLPVRDIVRLYIEQELGTPEIATRYGVSQTAIKLRLAKLGLMRSRAGVYQVNFKRGKGAFGKSGTNNPAWKGGKHLRGGYVNVWAPWHPHNNGGYVYEHRLVWEQTHGKLLPEGWIVHHLNGVKRDNLPENLYALPRKTHDKLMNILVEEIKRLHTENRLLREEVMKK